MKPRRKVIGESCVRPMQLRVAAARERWVADNKCLASMLKAMDDALIYGYAQAVRDMAAGIVVLKNGKVQFNLKAGAAP